MCSSVVIVNLGEGIYTRSQLKASSKGRPSIGILLLSNVALVAVRSIGMTICQTTACSLCHCGTQGCCMMMELQCSRSC